jgi:ferritin-like metal-binding protein YciE
MKTPKIETLNDLFLEELGDLFNAENQLVKALPKMAKATDSEDLRSVIEQHMQQTRNHVNRLEEIFKDLGEKPAQVVCKAMKGLIAEGEDIVHKSDRSPARDAAIIGAAQRVEHYEIAGYGTARSHAYLLGHKRAEEMLSETLQEEKQADENLNELAENNINRQAKSGGEDDFREEDEEL